eukprot:CAMPEP_0172319624 /NCGR_PEP_ID=MMETSP1058-20130122/38156_1 /TAXON_ID=83371 /ORGANISM="Detonula confervacea, Strain CCMP 353" /LENGTH=675 /DNA_ID=CAMNT_0013034707 /DNA_START=540 /DNA_END=2567 /DNA_ORIENTATION=-
MGDGSTGEVPNNKNELAMEIAITHCKDIIFLRGDTDMILNLYLSTGRLQELYDLSCYYTRKGCHYRKKKQGCVDLDNPELNLIWTNQVKHQNITRSYFKRGVTDNSFFMGSSHRFRWSFYDDDRDSPHWRAIHHMFLVKYFLHIFMENLSEIDKHFLNNQDCINLIGEYAGIKKEWIISKEDWYRDQAFEVVHFMHCDDWYFRSRSASSHFKRMKEFSANSCPEELNQTIDAAIEAGIKRVGDIRLQLRQEKLMSPSRWTEIIQSYMADHNLIYTINIKPALPWAFRKINSMAGYHVFGMNDDPALCITKFVTEAHKACHLSLYSFDDLFDFMDRGWDWDADKEEFEDLEEFEGNGRFRRAIRACVFIERKLAQCYFHKNKCCDEAEAILDLLPGVRESYMAVDPDDDIAFEFLDCSDQYASQWLSDVTKVVDALFEANLATAENLTVLFGRSDYVSYRIWELQLKRKEYRQMHISWIVTRSRIWKEGCVDNDKKLGLKIQYLTKSDRRQRFEDARKQMPMGNSISYLEPSLEQFAKKFGWNNLGIDSDKYYAECISDNILECKESIGSIAKRRRCELDNFLTVEEACRHFFDTSTIEEAIWDWVGIPRLIVLNGDEKKMNKSGWKHCKVKSVLGDETVQLGNRVAHVYSGSWCTIWKEQETQSEASSHSDMDSD